MMDLNKYLYVSLGGNSSDKICEMEINGILLNIMPTVGFELKLFLVDCSIPGTYHTLILRRSPKVSFPYCFIFKIILINTILTLNDYNKHNF